VLLATGRPPDNFFRAYISVQRYQVNYGLTEYLFIYLHIQTDNIPVYIIIEYTLTRSASPKYPFGTTYNNIAPVNKINKAHNEIIPMYLYVFVFKKPVINNISETIVDNTTKIVTNMCILFWKAPTGLDLDKGNNVYPTNDIISMKQNMQEAFFIILFILFLIYIKNPVENITVNIP
jgi:hypothetical protein